MLLAYGGIKMPEYFHHKIMYNMVQIRTRMHNRNMTQYCPAVSAAWNNKAQTQTNQPRAALLTLARIPRSFRRRQKHSPRGSRFALLHCILVCITREIPIKQTLTLKMNGCAFSWSHPAGRSGARRRLLFRELAAAWRHARPVRTDWPEWPRWREGGDESMNGPLVKLFETLNHLNQMIHSHAKWFKAIETPQTGGTGWSKRCKCNKNLALIYYI